MNRVLGRRCAPSVFGMLFFAATPLVAQQQQGDADKVYKLPVVFRDSTPLEVTLIAPFKQLKRERRGQSPYHAARIVYTGDSGVVSVPVKVKTRGIWRRQHCDLPPLRLNFSKDSVKHTVFHHLDKARLTMHCRDGDDYEQYVLQEFQLYRVQHLITPLSFDARLLRVTYVDAESKDTLGHRYAFVMEEDSAFAVRVGGQALGTKGATAADLDPNELAVFGVWQYFVGNTDFSVAALHNVVLLSRDTSYYPVAHDYDFSGAVNARYATPPPQLRSNSVADRIMRGYCVSPQYFTNAFALFNAKKGAIYALYADQLGSLLKRDVADRTLRYFDQFYATIANAREAKSDIIDACLGHPA
jgi:hypothetical protein